ncbi:MAG: DUF2321 domain-containing protein [Planctomycetes bacterium]|nr:DUF2321 domain-containing protein [Planctomycetota bacterium]
MRDRIIGYDAAQICLNGHIISDCIHASPDRKKPFCDKCGEKTISTCPSCNAAINGKYRTSNGYGISLSKSPLYCPNCGKPYPWTESKIQTAIQIFAEFGKLDENEKKTIEEDIKNVARDIPQSELSALRIKKMWEKYGRIAYNVIMEFASKVAAEILK